MSALLQVVASPRRQVILRLVWDVERSAGDIHERAGRITFGAVSQHLKVLEHAGLVACRKHGRQRFYRARRDDMGALRTLLEATWADALSDLKLLAEAEEARRGPRKKGRRTS